MDKLEELGYSTGNMFKKIDFKGLNYKDLDRFNSHDIKRDEMHSFYQTFDFLELIKKWPEIIGPKFATVTSPLRMKQDALFIVSKHGAYSDQISYLAEDLKKNIFKIFPQLKPVIKKLVFTTQEGFFREQEARLEAETKKTFKIHPQDPRFKVLKLEAERLFEETEDQELKQILTSLYVQSKLTQE